MPIAAAGTQVTVPGIAATGVRNGSGALQETVVPYTKKGAAGSRAGTYPEGNVPVARGNTGARPMPEKPGGKGYSSPYRFRIVSRELLIFAW